MQSSLYILAAVALIVVGVAFVPSYTAERASAAWEPVLSGLERVDPMDQLVQLGQPGDYVVFLEGPAQDALWGSANLEGSWVEFIDEASSKVLRSSPNVDFAYDTADRRGLALVEITAPRSDLYSLHVTGPDLEARGFQIAIQSSEVVEGGAGAASAWKFGKWAAVALIAIFALSFVAKARS